MPGHPDGLQRETVYSLLDDVVREHLLWYLSVVDRTTTREFAERVVTWQRETAVDLGVKTPRSVIIQLVHNHLPRLDEYDVVDYDRSRNTVTSGANFDALEPYVSDLELPVDPESADC